MSSLKKYRIIEKLLGEGIFIREDEDEIGNITRVFKILECDSKGLGNIYYAIYLNQSKEFLYYSLLNEELFI